LWAGLGRKFSAPAHLYKLVPSFTRYGDMNVVEKCTKWGG